MKILLTGGTGLVGKKVTHKLLECGHQVCILSRQAHPEQDHRIHYVKWDSQDARPIPPAACQGIEAVVNLMGENIATKRWSQKQKRKIENSRIKATSLLIAGLKQHLPNPLRCFLSASAIGIYPVQDGPIDEDTLAGENYLAQVCSNWEREAQKASTERLVILRIGVVLAREGGALAKMLPPFRLGLGGPIGNGTQMMSWIHVDDLANLIATALADKRYRGIYNAVSPQPVSNKAFGRTLGGILKRPAILPLPALALKLAMGEMASIMLDSQQVVPKRLLALGHEFCHPQLEGALRDILGK